MSSSNSPCAACKCLLRKCTQCISAPLSMPDQPLFAASYVADLLNELPASQREVALNSLAYEANYRLHDPIYGCVGYISVLIQKLKQVQYDVYNAKKELASYIGPSIMQQGITHPMHPFNNLSSSSVMPFNLPPMMALPVRAQLSNSQPQMVEAQHMTAADAAAAAATEHELFRDYDPQHQNEQSPPQQHELMTLKGGLDLHGATSAMAYNKMAATMSSSMVLGSYESASYNHLQHQQAPAHDTLNSKL